MSTPAGWYPDPQAEGQQRYWDGNAWTEHQAPFAQPQQPTQSTQPAWSAPHQSAPYAAAAPLAAKQKKPFWRRTWVLVTAGVLVAFIGIGAASGSSDPKDTAAKDNHTADVQKDKTSDAATEAPSTPDVTEAADPEPTPTKTPEPTKTPKPKPSYTASQEQAIGAAKDYLDYSAFSRTGLINQLSSKYGDGFSKADAIFAVNHIQVDWNEQAVQSAKDYLSMSHFSRVGLIQQLSSKYGDGYTVAQATYAANHVGL
ncbi:MAG TPA: Ltp family lipoprotein [Nocardioidaceae bacterium]|jgi:hypothetical protein